MASAMISWGFFSQTRDCGVSRMPRTVMTMPPRRLNAIDVWTARVSFSWSSAPYPWEMTTVAPEERPVKMPTTSWTITAAEPPTAARASEPRKRPTTMASTVL